MFQLKKNVLIEIIINGHDTEAQMLKNDIQNEIDRLKELLNSSSSSSEDSEEDEEDDSSKDDSKEQDDIESKLQEIKEESIKESKDAEEQYKPKNYEYNSVKKRW